MRIISDFHDYYDCMMTPADPEPLYLRKKIVIEKDVLPRRGFWWIDARRRIIGHAGQITKCLLLNATDRHGNQMDVPTWSLEDSLCEWAKHHQNTNRWSKRWHSERDVKKFWEESFDLGRLFEMAPIWIAERRKLVLNPCLKDIEFYRRWPPPQAFQDLRMWLSNQAQPEKPIPHIDDVTMAEAKGFDKFSFRKSKSGK